MNLLSAATALSPGADLWMTPDFEHSRWTGKLDWYLNFQIVRATRHKTLSTPNYTSHIQNQTGLDVYAPPIIMNAPLMLNSAAYLPCKWVIVIPAQLDFSHWVQQAAHVFKGLNKPLPRFFLPKGQDAGQFQKLWRAQHHAEDNFQEFTLVLD